VAHYDISIVIPCYNEAEGLSIMRDRLGQALTGLRERGNVQLVLVNDGSRDGTGELLEQTFGSWPDTVILHHATNRGLGAALRTGFAHAIGEIIVTCDSDGTYPFSEIPALLAHLTPDVDLVTASPYHPGGGIENVPAYRVFISKSASLCYRLLVDARIHTYTALFRACRRHVIDHITTRADGFLMVTEWLVEALLSGYRVAEYPTTLRVRQYGQSKARVWQITKTHIRYMTSILQRRLTQPRTKAISHGR
jgi:dolichol-phosphate mannosyltransferase